MISGAPTSAGNSSFTVTATDSTHPAVTASKSLSIKIVAIAVKTTSLVAGVKSKLYSAALSAYGGTKPLTWKISSGALPSGLKLSTAGRMTGRPAKVGTFKFTVKVIDAKGHTAVKKLSIKIT